MKDPELDLLNDLLRDHKGEVYGFIHLKSDVSGAYARDPRTICSGAEDYYTQSKLGFLNQMRLARGLPRIAVVLEKQTILRFELYSEDTKPVDWNPEKLDSFGDEDARLPLQTWNIWMEGHSAQGSHSDATLLGKQVARTFSAACKIFCADPEIVLGYGPLNEERGTLYGCRLFPTEAEARKRFG